MLRAGPRCENAGGCLKNMRRLRARIPKSDRKRLNSAPSLCF